MADDNSEKFNDSLNDMVGGLEDASGVTSDLVKALRQLNKEAQTKAKADEAEAKRKRELKEREDQIDNALKQMTGSAIAAVAGLNSATSSIYGSDKAFTSVIPTLDLFASTTKSIVEALGQLGSGIEIFGFSTGRMSEGMAKMTSVGIDILSNLSKFQLETAQKVADTYVEMSKSGASFGGSINRMAMSAADAELPIQSFGKLITTNADGLSRMGLGVQEAAVVVGQMGNNIGKSNPRLLAMYGSYDALTQAVAEYTALQSQVGAGELKDRKALEIGATKYLDQQRELTALTGKSADQLKKEQEERQKDAAYQLALNKMTADERLNSEYAISQISAKYGEDAAKYAKEYISTGGKVFSQAALAFESTTGPIAQTVQGIAGNLKQSESAFKNNTNVVIAQNAQRNMTWAKEQELMAQMTQAGYGNEIVKAWSNTAGAIVAGNAQAENAMNARAKLEEDKSKGVGAASDAFIDATNQLKASQMEIDTLVIKNMSGMKDLVKFLYEQQQNMISAQDHVIESINSMGQGVDKFKNALGKLSDFMLDKMGLTTDNNTAQLNAINQRAVATQAAQVKQQDYNQQEAERKQAAIVENLMKQGKSKAEAEAQVAQWFAKPGSDSQNTREAGGIAFGPTLTGEAGPEAHIPLKGGSVPMNIDFGPVIQAMSQQSRLTEELISQVRDSKDVQERILQASY